MSESPSYASPYVHPCNNFYNAKAWSCIGAKLANPEYKIISVKNTRPSRPYFRLKLYIGEEEDKQKQQPRCLSEMYKVAALETNKILERYKMGERVRFDAGFDLFAPEDCTVGDNVVAYKLDHGVQCSMEKVEFRDGIEVSNPVGYYLYPRSSMGTKTPLSLANSVGVIDSGYRGNIIAALHCTRTPLITSRGTFRRDPGYKVTKFQRLVQLCPPDLSYPMEVVIVDTEEELGDAGARGRGGFGSTGD
jgi:dUTP pyrophosphatase